MPRKRKPAERRRKGEGSYRWDAKNQRHIWRITRAGRRYEVADRDADRAKARFNEVLEGLNAGRDIQSARQLFQQYADYYVANILPNEAGESTIHNYAKRLNRYILPTIGEYALADLRKPVLQAWVNAMQAHGWALTSIRQALSLVRRILDTAVPEILEYNAAIGVKVPKAPPADDDDETPGRALTHEEIARVRAAVQGTFYEALYALALTLGLRRGELLGLRWADLDLEAQTLRVRQQVRQLDREIKVTPRLKTPSARRTLPLSDGLVTILLAHMARVQAMRDKAGDAWVEGGFVFPNDRGGHRRPDNLTTHCARLLRRLEITGHHLHDLRATAITSWREGGADDETTAALAGHKDVKISAKVYSDAEARKRVVVDRMG